MLSLGASITQNECSSSRTDSFHEDESQEGDGGTQELASADSAKTEGSSIVDEPGEG